MTNAYNLILNMKNPNQAACSNNCNVGGNDGLTFVMHGKNDNDDDEGGVKPWHNDMTCYHCGERGHIAKHCPKKKKNQDKSPEKHSTNANVGKGKAQLTQASAPPNVVWGGSVKSDDTESKTTELLPGQIPNCQNYDPVTGKALLTILEDDDSFKEFNFHMISGRSGLPSSWLLLDSESTCHVF